MTTSFEFFFFKAYKGPASEVKALGLWGGDITMERSTLQAPGLNCGSASSQLRDLGLVS